MSQEEAGRLTLSNGRYGAMVSTRPSRSSFFFFSVSSRWASSHALCNSHPWHLSKQHHTSLLSKISSHDGRTSPPPHYLLKDLLDGGIRRGVEDSRQECGLLLFRHTCILHRLRLFYCLPHFHQRPGLSLHLHFQLFPKLR